MRSLLGVLSIYLLIKLFLIGVGMAIGFLLHWLVPTIDVGVGILIGIIATGMAIHFYARLTGSLETYGEADIDPGPEPTSPIIIYPPGPLPSRRKRRCR